MSDGPERDRMRLNVRDGLMLVLGALGLALFFLLLPAQHPDAAADYALGPQGAADASARFLASAGYSTDGLEQEVSFRRLPRLLDTLQATLGRTEAVSALREDGGERLPAFHWRVTWYRRPTLADDERERLYTVALGPTGAVWEFTNEEEAPMLDRAAVSAVVSGAGADDIPAAFTDSLLSAVLRFDTVDSLWRAVGNAAWTPGSLQRSLEEIAAARGMQGVTSVTLRAGPEWAVALAEHHLARTLFAGYDLRVDSTYLVRSSTGARDVAAVRFETVTPYLGRTPTTTLRVAPTGALVGMEADFVASRAAVADGADGISVTLASGVLQGGIYVVLVLVLLGVFFRRLGARLLDTRMALRDALWGGFFAGLVVATTVGTEFVGEFDAPLLGLLAASLIGLVVGTLALLLMLLLSSAADSVGRDVWPEKLEALHLVREASILNAPVGRALLRGTALSFALLGVLTLSLAVMPGVSVPFGDTNVFLGEMTLSPLGFVFGMSAFGALFVVLTVLLGLGSLLARRWRAGVVVPVLVVVLAAASAGPIELGSVAAAWGVSAVVGGVLVGAFWRYGALACFVALLLVGLLWDLSSGWLVAGAPDGIDFWLALGASGAVLVTGLVGIFNGREVADLQQYVPAYISELAQKERMGRELEIAHQVQEFFLPRRMPDVEGLDVAAMCLAAQEVGGDYYDFIEIAPGRLGIAVGDVSGKGIQAAFFMTLTKGFLQTLARSIDSPAEVLRRTNALFRENAPRGLFVSMIYGVMDVEARTFTFARAGHNPLIVTRAPSQETDLVQPGGLAIGLVTGRRFDDALSEKTLHLRPGDTLVFYTDGFSEAMNASRAQYGDDRLARKVSDVGRRSAGEILRAVTEDVHHFVEAVGRHDDMTMVVLKLARRADAPTGAARGRLGAASNPAVPAVVE